MNYSTLIETQCARSREMLRSGEKSTIKLRGGGLMMPATRLKELVDKYGYEIAGWTLQDSGTSGETATRAWRSTRSCESQADCNED